MGTAQFGSHYGVTNKLGQPSRKECARIIETAIEAGIKYFDTAAYYGDADFVLARHLPLSGFRVVTKAKTFGQVAQSEDLFGDNLYAILSDFVLSMNPEIKSGISVYWPIVTDPEAQIVQMPLNIADRRNLRLAQLYKSRAVEIHARSIFLQGLLLEKGATICQCLKFALEHADIALVGVNSADELKQIIEAIETLDEETATDVPQIEQLDPRKWHANH